MTATSVNPPKLSPLAQVFTDYPDRSPAPQDQIHTFTSPLKWVELTQSEGFDLPALGLI
ncbi:MAG: hypothetical protein ACO4CG_08770 [Prochlorothrix sp.]|nr:hypothetical protein [Prochlorothrix sp.]